MKHLLLLLVLAGCYRSPVSEKKEEEEGFIQGMVIACKKRQNACFCCAGYYYGGVFKCDVVRDGMFSFGLCSHADALGWKIYK